MQNDRKADYLDEMEAWTRQRGRLAGVRYGEGFRQYLGHAYPQSPLLQELITLDRAIAIARRGTPR